MAASTTSRGLWGLHQCWAITCTYGLLVALAIALLVAAVTDLRRRQIDNWLNAAIALAAPLFWWASGLSLWPGVGHAARRRRSPRSWCSPALFALRWMGGGDVKLLTALALWIAAGSVPEAADRDGAARRRADLVFGAWHIARRQRDRLADPLRRGHRRRRTVGHSASIIFPARADRAELG